MPKSKRKYTQRQFKNFEDAQTQAGHVAQLEPWNQPEILMREAAEEIKHKNRRLEIADAKLEMVYLITGLIRRDADRPALNYASQEGIVSRLERALAPVPAPALSYKPVAPKTHRVSKSL